MISIFTSNGKWKVYRKGSKIAMKICRNRQEAIEFGNEKAIEEETLLTVHFSNGQIDFRLDYSEE